MSSSRVIQESSHISTDGCIFDTLNYLSNTTKFESVLQDGLFSVQECTNDSNYVKVRILNAPEGHTKCIITTSIQNVPFTTLIDTGADSCNYISEKAYLSTATCHSRNLFKPSTTSHRVANNTTLHVLGETMINLMISGTEFSIPFIIVQDILPYETILGWNQFIKPNDGIIDSKKATLQLTNPRIMHMNVAYLTEDSILESFSETVVSIELKNDQDSKDITLTQFEPLFERMGVMVTPGVYQAPIYSQGRTLNVIVANITKETIELPRSTIIGRVESYENEEKITNETPASIKRVLNPTVNEVKIENTMLLKDQKDQMNHLINKKFKHLFEEIENHGGAVKVSHHIDTGSARPISQPPYRASIKEREAIEEQMTVMLKKGVIRPSRSPWAARVVMVKKKNGKLRFCLDFRGLNKLTKKDVYPLPRIDDSLASLQTGKYFTTLDLSAGYWQIPMNEDSIEKTAFITQSGLFEFLVLPFGLTNAPATFQRYMDAITAGLKWKCLLVYLDDIIIFSPTFDDHLRDVEEVLKRLEEANLKLNPEKCFVCQDKLKYLGHIVSSEGIEADYDKIKAIVEMSSPENREELRTVLGGSNYYRKFIPKYAELCSPLYKITHQDTEFIWSASEEKVLQNLKSLLSSTPILRHPDFNYPFELHTDASDNGLGATLIQVINGEERVIMFLSRSLQPEERKWCTREKEALAILWGFESVRHYVIGYKFEVVTDHESLKWLLSVEKPARLVRWAVRLSEFDFTIRHRKQALHCDADLLSRFPLTEAYENEEKFKSSNLCYDYVNSICELENIKKEEIIEKQRNQSNLFELINQCESRTSDPSLYRIENQLLYKIVNNIPVLMAPQNMRSQILKQYHTHNISVHMATDRLTDLLKSRFYWTGMDQDIKQFVKTCDLCQRIKTKAPIRNGLLRPIISTRPFEIIGVDIVIMRRAPGGNRYIVVCIDYFTNWVEAAPMKTLTAKELIRVFFKIIISRHGAPEFLRCDSGTQFMSDIMNKLCEAFQIKRKESAAYHQQANGKVEKFIGFLKKALALTTPQDKLEIWDQMIDHCLLVYRTTLSRTLNDNPFFMIYGRDARLPQDNVFDLGNQGKRGIGHEGDGNYQLILHQTLKAAYATLTTRKTKEQQNYKAYYDKRQNDVKFEVNDLVLVLFDTPAKGPLMPRWEGPFEIQAELDSVTYRVGNNNRIFAVHVNRLTKYHQRIEINQTSGQSGEESLEV